MDNIWIIYIYMLWRIISINLENPNEIFDPGVSGQSERLRRYLSCRCGKWRCTMLHQGWQLCFCATRQLKLRCQWPTQRSPSMSPSPSHPSDPRSARWNGSSDAWWKHSAPKHRWPHWVAGHSFPSPSAEVAAAASSYRQYHPQPTWWQRCTWRRLAEVSEASLHGGGIRPAAMHSISRMRWWQHCMRWCCTSPACWQIHPATSRTAATCLHLHRHLRPHCKWSHQPPGSWKLPSPTRPESAAKRWHLHKHWAWHCSLQHSAQTDRADPSSSPTNSWQPAIRKHHHRQRSQNYNWSRWPNISPLPSCATKKLPVAKLKPSGSCWWWHWSWCCWLAPVFGSLPVEPMLQTTCQPLHRPRWPRCKWCHCALPGGPATAAPAAISASRLRFVGGLGWTEPRCEWCR